MELSEVKTIGSGLARPEGVAACKDGSILAADARGMIARITPDGQTAFYGDLEGLPNGICLDGQGNCLVANIGNGQVQSLNPDGSHQVLLTEVRGRPMGSPNFPLLDAKGRLWVTNSTDRPDVNDAINHPAPDGCLARLENGRACIAADHIWFANGLAMDAAEEYLYVAATTQRAVLRYRVAPDGSLSQEEIYGPAPLAGPGFPDGLAFDQAGNLWITFPLWNAVGYLTPGRELVMYLTDPSFRVLQRPTNICFGGLDLRTAFLGSLEGSNIPCFTAPFPGMKLVHQ